MQYLEPDDDLVHICVFSIYEVINRAIYSFNIHSYIQNNNIFILYIYNILISYSLS